MGMKLEWLGPEQKTFLQRGYIKEGSSIEERYENICHTIEKISGLYGISSRFKYYIENNWISFSSPILANFGEPHNLPISCNFSATPDSLDGIFTSLYEMAMLTKNGAGVARDFSLIRPIGESIFSGGKSDGIMPWIDLFAQGMDKISQSSVRRGFLTAYLSVTHPEIMSLLDIGTDGNKIQNITTGVKIPKGWMQALKDGDKDIRKIWSKILRTRNDIGYPYIIYEENMNKNTASVYKEKDLWLDMSNICSECCSFSSVYYEYVCCLASVNALHFDDWKTDDNFIFDVNIMLDCVLTEYIEKARHIPGLEKAVRYAEEFRTIGVGVLGFHSYLQKNMIPFGSIPSYIFNEAIFKRIRQESDKASRWMAENWGEPEFMKGTGWRNDNRMAQAPTKSTSMIMGNLSSGIEPIKSNFHEKALAKVQVEYKNPQLLKLLDSKGKNNKQVWKSIAENNGSVSHLDFLSELEKDVFKTFAEISQVDVIKLAAARQKHIDQSQSLNLMIHPDTKPKDINNLMLMAFDEGIKTLYYQYSINGAMEFNRSLLECSACEA